MKSFSLLIAVLLFAINAHSQFLNNTCEWVVKREYSGGFVIGIGNVWHKNYVKQTIVGDTTIGTYQYHLIQENGIDTLCTFPSFSFVQKDTINVLQGGVRETADKKFYFYSFTTNTEVLLFDFDKNVNDPIPSWLTTISCSPDTVLSINSIPFGVGSIKQFDFKNSAADMFEGIGCHNGFIEDNSFCIDFDGYTSLICFHKDGYTLNISAGDCTTPSTTGVQNISETKKVKVYPNPTSNVLNISIENKEKYIVEVYNTLGEKVFADSNSLEQINTLHWSNGIYLVKIVIGNKILNQKIIKQ